MEKEKIVEKIVAIEHRKLAEGYVDLQIEYGNLAQKINTIKERVYKGGFAHRELMLALSSISTEAKNNLSLIIDSMTGQAQ